MYTIEVSYQTGDSFNSEDLTEDIGLVWKNKELAKKCLQSIKEHYELCEELEDTTRTYARRKCRSQEEIFKDVRSRFWFCLSEYSKGKLDSFSLGYNSCQAEMDDGSFRVIPTNMWMGYFEQLYSARIICLNNDEDQFTVE